MAVQEHSGGEGLVSSGYTTEDDQHEHALSREHSPPAAACERTEPSHGTPRGCHLLASCSCVLEEQVQKLPAMLRCCTLRHVAAESLQALMSQRHYSSCLVVIDLLLLCRIWCCAGSAGAAALHISAQRAVGA